MINVHRHRLRLTDALPTCRWWGGGSARLRPCGGVGCLYSTLRPQRRWLQPPTSRLTRPGTYANSLNGPQWIESNEPSSRMSPQIMALAFPYARYGCPCSDHAGAPTPSTALKRSSKHIAAEADSAVHDDGYGDDDSDDETFNPHEPRAAFSLFPLDQLLYCDECNATRCARCCSEEMMCWYCPNCMFEVPSSGVKSDGNR